MDTLITDEQVDAVCDRRYQETLAAVEAAIGKPLRADDPIVERGFAAIEALCDVALSREIAIAESLEAALLSTGQSYADGIGIARLHSVEQDLACSELLGEDPDPSVVALREMFLLVYDTILFDEKSVLVPMPTVLKRDAEGELHCEDGPAVEWPGQREFFWHGQGIDAIVIERPADVTAEYLRELSAEQRRASYEAIGHERALELIGDRVDAATIAGLEYELYRTSAEGDEGDAWLRMRSPVLQDGSQPWYVEPVHEDCRSCAEALGWRATGELGVAVRYEIET